MPYIHFTEEQKHRAASVDLVDFLQRRGERLIRSGPEYRMASDHSITIRGNEWYDHATGQGGGPVSFIQNYLGLSYPEAVARLLDGEQGQVYKPVPRERAEPKVEFIQPPANREMRRLYAYLLQKRHIDREVLTAFVRAGLIYEDAEYHNAVFVGKDEHGVVRHAHKHGTNDRGKSFRGNVAGSDPRYSFHWNGTSDRLYVFEAPIDLLSFLSLRTKGWQEQSYVALCGTAEHAMLWMLEQDPGIRRIILCLDHDEAGIEASGRLAEIAREHRCETVFLCQSIYKDWNEDLKAGLGLKAQPAEEHPQFIVAPEVCGRIGAISESVKLDRLTFEIPHLIQHYRNNLRWARFDRTMDCAEQASALALAACGRELRQMGEQVSTEELTMALRRRIQPHHNRSDLQNRHSGLTEQFQRVLEKTNTAGIRSQTDKRQLAAAWMDLAVSFAMIPVKYEAEKLRRQGQTTPPIRQETR